MTLSQPQTVLVTGANGFIGQWLVPALLRRGHAVIAALRNVKQREADYRARLSRLGLTTPDIRFVELDLADIDAFARALPAADAGIDVVFHLAAAYAWHLDPKQAQQLNVDAGTALVRWASGIPGLRRFLWIGGYRIAAGDEGSEAEQYRRLGGYEASKRIAHQHMIAECERLQVPWTALNPAAVIGDSETGETTQYLGVGELVGQLFYSKLAALPGSAATFVPLCHVDYVAEFGARVFEYADSANRQYWLLDPATPPLHDLLRWVGGILGVPVPRRAVPVRVLKCLPAALLPGSRETLSFLSEDRYETESAQQLARRMGIEERIPVRHLERWIAEIVSADFGQAGHIAGPGSERNIEDSFEHGQWIRRVEGSGTPVVYLHGLPLNGDSWGAVQARLPNPAIVPDLPGMGRSGAAALAGEHWLARVVTEPSILVGHSRGAGMALAFARQHPEKVKALVLVSPFFLQGRPPWFLRVHPLGWLISHLLSQDDFARRIHPDGLQHPAVASAFRSLQRPAVRRQVFASLARAGGEGERAQLRQWLEELRGMRVQVVIGDQDPLQFPWSGATTVIAGTGHNPQLSHPDQVAQVIQAVTPVMASGLTQASNCSPVT